MVERPTPCMHTNQEDRLRPLKNGAMPIYSQCLDCGQSVGKAIRRENYPKWQRLSLWDTELTEEGKQRWEEQWRQYRQASQQSYDDEITEKRRRHAEYLQTPAWRQRRLMRLALDDEQCQAKLVGCRGVATEVHHTTYQHWGNEPLFDLVSVCRPCHAQLSEMEGRGANATPPPSIKPITHGANADTSIAPVSRFADRVRGRTKPA